MAQTTAADDQLAIVRSTEARRIDDQTYDQPYWVFHNGTYHQGRPGSANYQVTRFSRYGQYIQQPDTNITNHKDTDALATSELLQSSEPESIAAWQWRFSIPLLTLIVMLLAIPLSKTNPRRGRYSKLFPSIILYLIYLVLLNAAKGELEEGSIPTYLGLWWVHGVFLLLALVLLWIGRFRLD